MSAFYIPEKIHVGFQHRKDTYTKKLAYVIYEDEKGVLRKQTSWDGWRDKSIPVQVFDNKPTDHFLINRDVKRGGYWGSGRTMLRIYDPRDFEFEISVSNMIEIMMCTDISRRDISGECVYAWYGKDLVLLPVDSDEYREAMAASLKKAQKISADELTVGMTYPTKYDSKQVVYIGRFKWYEWKSYITDGKRTTVFQKTKGSLKYVFFNEATQKFVTLTPAMLADPTSSDIVDVNNLVATFLQSSQGQPNITNTEFCVKEQTPTGNVLLKFTNDEGIEIFLNNSCFTQTHARPIVYLLTSKWSQYQIDHKNKTITINTTNVSDFIDEIPINKNKLVELIKQKTGYYINPKLAVSDILEKVNEHAQAKDTQWSTEEAIELIKVINGSFGTAMRLATTN